MNLEDFKSFLLQFDPKVSKFFSTEKSGDYTVWTPHNPAAEISDDDPEEISWIVTVDRWSKNPKDNLAKKIYEGLVKAYVPVTVPEQIYEPDTGMFHWVLDATIIGG